MSLPEHFKEATVDDLVWMARTWICEIWGGVFEEHWLEPQGRTMQGVGRHLDDDRTSFMEFMSIEPSSDGLAMWVMVGSPSRGDHKPIPFKLTDLSSHMAAFENSQHDFPNRIEYRFIEHGKMDCTLTGTRSGEACREEFKFRSAE